MSAASSPPSDTFEDDLRAALAVAKLPILLMVLHQLTGDPAWLEEPYRPGPIRSLADDDPHDGIPEAQREEIRDAAFDAIVEARRHGTPAEHPDAERFVRMMSACVALDVDEAYAPYMAQQLGWARPGQPVDATVAELDLSSYGAVIVGAGVSGLALAHRLKADGIPFTLVDRNDEIGGTWFENRYPGCGVDTPSHIYSYSFDRGDWSKYFARRDEVHGYFRDIADRHDLRPHVQLRTTVTAARWLADAQVWELELEQDGETRTVRTRFLVAATGLFRPPSIPDIPGMEDFEGEIHHSAEWPADLEVAGRDVAVIGTGASAMQIVPAVAPVANRVTVFQRSPQWVMPVSRYFDPVAPEVRFLFDEVPYYADWYRFRLGWVWNESLHSMLHNDPDWEGQPHSTNYVNERLRQRLLRYIEEALPGRPDLQDAVTPSYPPFAKRLLLDNGWYASLLRDDVELVTRGVSRFTRDGVIDSGGREHRVTVVALATGFQTERYLYPLSTRLIGSHGRSLHEVWGTDPRAYLGLTAPAFPNLFFMYGPNTNPPGGSYVTVAESQANYIVDAIRRTAAAGIGAIECRTEVHDRYNESVDAANTQLLWSHPSVDNYYKNAAGRVITNSPWSLLDYWQRTHRIDLDDYLTTPVVHSGDAAASR